MKRLVSICAIILAFCVVSEAATWNVPGDYPTIQAAIDAGAVMPGDKIMVSPGYHSGATVTKAVEIKGESGAIINAGPLYSTSMPCGTIVLNIGFKLGFAGDPPANGATISGLTFENIAFPVFSRGTNDVTVTQCVMLAPLQGVTNWSGSGWEISHNVITDLRSANGGGIGILVGDYTGTTVSDNIVSHNTISGTLHVASCDLGGYDGSGIVLFADWRYGRSGALSIEFNRVVKNKISLTSDSSSVVNVHALELTEHSNPGGIVIQNNAIGFNDLRGTESQILLSPSDLDNPVNDISRNLGENRGHGLHPSVFSAN